MPDCRHLETLSGHQKDQTVGLVLGVEEVHVTGRTARFAQRIGQLQNRAVIVAQRLFVLRDALGNHKPVVVDGLDFQIVVEIRNAFELLERFALDHRVKQLARLTGRTKNQSLAVLDKLGTRHQRTTVKMIEKTVRNELVQVFQSDLILHQNDEMVTRQIL